MTWLLYNLCSFLTVGKVIIKSFKLLKASSEEDVILQSRDILICWIVYFLLVGFESSGLEQVIKWFPGYFYIKSLSLIIIAWPQLHLARVLFFEVIKPSVDWSSQYLNDIGIKSPAEAIEMIPFLIVHFIFPILGKSKSSDDITTLSSDSDKYNQKVKSKLKSTSKKLSILTEYLDELELRGSHSKKDFIVSGGSGNNNNSSNNNIRRSSLRRFTLSRTDSEATISMEDNQSSSSSSSVFTRLNIFDKLRSSPDKISTTNQSSSISPDHRNHNYESITSPKHNRRRSLEMLQSILERHASSTLQFLGLENNRRSNHNNSSNDEESRSNSRGRSGSNGRSRSNSIRSSSRTRSRRPSSENLLLVDPIEISKNVTTRRRLRTVMTKLPTTVFQMPQNLYNNGSGSNFDSNINSNNSNSTLGTFDTSSSLTSTSSTRNRLMSARNSLGKDIDNILKGFTKPSTRNSFKLPNDEITDALSRNRDHPLTESIFLEKGIDNDADTKSLNGRRFSFRLASKSQSKDNSRYSTPTKK